MRGDTIMISASEIHELRFEKAAFGYKQEDIDEFLNKLEEEVAIAQRELDDSNNKIQVLADKVREYMRDEDALKDALLGAQKEGHRIIAEANTKAEEIIAQAKEKADAMMDEVTVQHDALIEKNEAEIEEEHKKLAAAKKQVADFKKALFDMYKEHLNMLSAMPDEDDTSFGVSELSRLRRRNRKRQHRLQQIRSLRHSSLQRPFRAHMIPDLATCRTIKTNFTERSGCF